MKTPYRVLIRKSDIDFFDVHDLHETMEDLGNGFIASYLTEEQYVNQLCNPDALWKCLVTKECGGFDDEWYESQFKITRMKGKLIEILKFMESSFREHYSCEDSWYNCPAHPDGCLDEDRTGGCNCGADDYNKKLQLNINKLKEVIDESN